MTPCAWKFDAILVWEDFPAGSEEPGAWVCGTTTQNLMGQGRTPVEAFESLSSCVAAQGSWDLAHGRTLHELFRVTAHNDIPIEPMCVRNNEVRVTLPFAVLDKSVRYITSGTVTLEDIRSVVVPEKKS